MLKPSPKKHQPKVLVVDDEDDILDLLQYNLENEGLATVPARDGVEALDLAGREEPDLIILDIMMPRMDGIEVCRRIRQDARLRNTPILMLTALGGEDNHVKGLDVGADSYLPKSSSIAVILSQAKALIRGVRRHEEPPNVLHIHGLEIDRDRYVVFKQEADERLELRFPRKEFELLHFLASHPGRVFTRQDLLDQVWGADVYVVDRTIDVHVRKIREKLGSASIETIKGVGYKFAE